MYKATASAVQLTNGHFLHANSDNS